MKARLPFRYEWGTRRTARGAREARVVFGSVEVDIPEMRKQAVPVVATWSLRSPHAETANGGRTVSIRYGDGQFYARASRDGLERVYTDILAGGREHTLVQQAEALVDHLTSGYFQGVTEDMAAAFLKRELVTWGGENLAGLRAGDVRIVDDSSSSAHASMMERARDLVVIGHEFWRRIEEPKLMLSPTSQGLALVKADFHDEFDYARGIEVSFRSDVYNLADAGAMRADMERLRYAPVMFDVTDIEIADPALFTFDGVRNRWWRLLCHVDKRYADSVGGMATTVAADFVALRQARESLRRPLAGPIDAADLADTLGRFLRTSKEVASTSIFFEMLAQLDAQGGLLPVARPAR